MIPSYIIAFNKKLANLVNSISHPYLSQLLKEMETFADFYSAVDSIGCKYGVEIAVDFVVNDFSEISGYIPKLLLKEKVPNGFSTIEKRLTSSLKSVEHCYSYLAKEWLYAILGNENFIRGKSIH